MSHAEVAGAQYGSEKGMAITNNVTIPLPLIQDKRLSYVALGHIHKHQVLSKPGDSPLIVYSGSPQRIDFGEEKEEKGFVMVEIKDTATTFQFIPTPARGFLTMHIKLKGDDPNPTQTILDEISKHDLVEKIIRMSIDIPAECDKEIEMERIKKSLASANFIASISRNVERKERKILEGMEEVERLTPKEALQKYFESRKYSPEKIKELEKYAAEIING